jgi:hypothetical protein
MAGEQECDFVELVNLCGGAELCLQQHWCIWVERRLDDQPDVCGTRLSELGGCAAGDESTAVDDVDLIGQ